MAIERQVGYEYRGWKLGEVVKYKNNNTNYNIIGFDEREEEVKIIAISRNCHNKNIRSSRTATSYINTSSNCFMWVSEDEIAKINANTNQKPEYIVTEEMVKNMPCDIKNVSISIISDNDRHLNLIKSIVKNYDSFLIGNIVENLIKYQKDNNIEHLEQAKDYLDKLINQGGTNGIK